MKPEPVRKTKSLSQESTVSATSKAWRCSVDKDLTAYKVFCFFLYGAYGSLLPYLPLYFKQLGIHAFEAGVIIGVRPMVQIIAAPFYGALADRYHIGKQLLLGGVLGWIIKALLLLSVRPQNQDCISIYTNVTVNVTNTYIYAVPLWNGDQENNPKWTLVPANSPVLVEEAKLTLVSQQKQNKIIEQNGQKKPIVLYEMSKRNFSKDSVEMKVESLAGVRFLEDNFNDRSTPLWENSAFKESNRSEIKEIFQPEHGEKYAEQITDTRKTTAIQNPINDVRRNKRSDPQKGILTSHSEFEELPSQSKLNEMGKAVTHIVKSFDPKLNITAIYVTQIDIYETKFMFIIFTLFIILGEFLESPTYTLSDTSLLDRLGEDREYYGNIRMFGSLGWAFAGLSVGYLVMATKFDLCKVTSGNYLVAFYVFIGCCIVAFFSVFGFTFTYNQKKSSAPGFREVVQLLLNLRFSSFLISTLFVGWCYGFLIHFVNWFIDDLEGSSLVMGVAGAAREVMGLAFFFIGGSVIGVLGHVNTIILCLFSYLGLFYSYSNVTSPWVVVPLEMLAGANYALAWSTCVNYTNLVGASLGVSATVQGQ